MNVHCTMNFSLFPFDLQRCSIHFEANIHSTQSMIVTWNEALTNGQNLNKPDNFATIGFTTLQTRFTNSNSSNTLTKLNHSRCSLEFTLARHYAHYLVCDYLPTGLIVLVSWTSFWLEITSSPARVTLGVTTMLALITSFKSMKSLQLPSTSSYMNGLDVWNLVCTGKHDS